MDETALLACIEWVGHGFEIVQSIFPGWKFSAPDAVAAFGLHGALLIGPCHSVAACTEDWSRTLSTFEIDLKRDDTVADHGRGTNVLDGPVSALHHLVDILERDQVNPPLANRRDRHDGNADPCTSGWTRRDMDRLSSPASRLTVSVSASLELKQSLLASFRTHREVAYFGQRFNWNRHSRSAFPGRTTCIDRAALGQPG